jgi:hypothetical protein
LNKLIQRLHTVVTHAGNAKTDAELRNETQPVTTWLVIVLALAILSPLAIAVPRSNIGPSPIPVPRAHRTFVFASPNFQESLSDEEARRRLTSFAQRNATSVADRAACALSTDVQISNGLGIYDSSAENSFIVEANFDRERSEYLAALLGRYSLQRFVLLFIDESGGKDRLWIIGTQRPLHEVIASLRKAKLMPVTIQPRKDRIDIWFVDPTATRAESVKEFTLAVKGQVNLVAGIAKLLGDRDRSEAARRWRQSIGAFEQRSGLRLSSRLASADWRHSATVHTCSRELSTP